jgi:glutamine synthetase
MYDETAGDRLLSELGRQFVAGVLEHLPALVALTCPSFNSYERLRPDAWAGSTVSWGMDNRECTVRVASSFRGREMESTNVELKACDPSCNPYLALGGLILAGLDGVARGLQPPEPARLNPARLSEEERRRSGIRPLPGSLREALQTLQADEVLFPALGDLLGRCIIGVRTAEIEALEQMTPDQARLAHLRVF